MIAVAANTMLDQPWLLLGFFFWLALGILVWAKEKWLEGKTYRTSMILFTFGLLLKLLSPTSYLEELSFVLQAGSWIAVGTGLVIHLSQLNKESSNRHPRRLVFPAIVVLTVLLSEIWATFSFSPAAALAICLGFLDLWMIFCFLSETGMRSQAQVAWQKQFDAFMDNSPFIAWVKNSAGEHEYLSQPYEMQIGTPIENWKGKTDFELWPKDVAESHLEMDQIAIESGQAIIFDSNHPLPTGEIKNWYVVKFPFKNGSDETFIGGIALDVTEQRKASIERDRFFETSSELMCIADANLVFKRVNRAFSDILGYKQDEMVSQSFRDFVHAEDQAKLEPAVRRLQSNERFIRFETRYRCSDGTYRLIDWTTPLTEENDTIFAVGRDITEQRFLERRLLQIVDEEQQRFAMDLHDGLGQELTGLAMMAESLALHLKNQEFPEHKLAEKISVQLDSSLQLTRNLARGMRPIEIETNGLVSALSQLADKTSERYPIECHFESKEITESINLDAATQLYRIAQEAITNAAKHAKPKLIQIQLVQADRTLQLKIDDDGAGIENWNESKAGIGMKSMRYRSNIIGGKLHVNSSTNSGTSVSCTLSLP